MSFKPNTLYYSDGYKIGHKKMLAPGTTHLYGTWIPRSTKHAPKGIDKIVSFGQQLVVRWLHDEFTENFFYTNERRDIRDGIIDRKQKASLDYLKEKALQFTKDMSMYLGMEYDGKHFEELWDLGYLPIRFKALPEGIETSANVPHMTFVNTVPGFGWLTLYLETVVSSLAWKPATSATIALKYKRNLFKWVMRTDPGNAWLIPFLAHDFSARGLSPWDMLSSGLGHATSFRGSDTLVVIPGARYFYGEPENEVCINSVNASEHSVSTTCIFTMGESQMLKYFMDQYPKGILSVVSDTFDLFKLITEYLVENKEQIMSRDGKLVIRPDSGDPVDIICGSVNIQDYGDKVSTIDELKDWAKDELKEVVRENTPHGECGDHENSGYFRFDGKIYKISIDLDWNRYDKQYYFIDGSSITACTEVELSSIEKGVIELLWDIFGGTINEQGYKVLDPHIGAIYGDSITTNRQVQIYERLAAKGFASTNIVLGVGSFTYQMNTRDTFGFAAKGAQFTTNGVDYNIYKDPVTDDGTKKSLKGFVAVTENLEVLTECTREQEATGILQTIYEDGKFYNQTTLSQVRVKIDSLIK